MKRIIVLSSLIIAFGCADEIDPTQRYGTKLIKIEYSYDDETWIDNFFYNSDGLLAEIESFLSQHRYKIVYSNGRVSEFSTFGLDRNDMYYSTSIEYDSLGNLAKIDDGRWIFEYEFDDRGKVSERSASKKETGEYVQFEKYYWNGQNVERVEVYNANDVLLYEYLYTYDDKMNYKKNIPIYLYETVNWSDNNITAMDWNEYNESLEFTCRPCTSTYKYNLDAYPVEINTNSGQKIKLMYK